MNELTAEWVAKAEDDFAAAGLLLRGGEHPLPDLSCFHSQQCAEKYLKAFLQEYRVRFERTHDLVTLLNLCSSVTGDLETLRDDINRLGNFAVAIRYPGLTATLEIAEQSLSTTKRVRDFVRLKLLKS